MNVESRLRERGGDGVKADAVGLFRPPQGRSECEVAGEVIVRLIRAGIVRKSAAAIRDATAAVGIPVDVVRRAWTSPSPTVPLNETPTRAGDDLPRVQPPPPPLPPPEDAKETPASEWPEWKKQNAERMQAINAVRIARKNPEPGRRICAKCNQVKEVDDFDRAGGKRHPQKIRSWCRPCMKEYQSERYLSVEKAERLGHLLRFVVQQGDECVGVECPGCTRTLEIGEHVQGTTVLWHSECVERESS